ncbi:hypothetical protein Droror1_Dr00020382 [Drosera rotundifolia]
MMGVVPLRSRTVLVKDLPTHYGRLTVIVKKRFLCQGFAVDQIARGHLRIVTTIIARAKIDWAFIMLNLWKENREEVKSNSKRKTYLRMIMITPKIPPREQARPSDGQQTLKRKKASIAGASLKKQKRSAQPAQLTQTEEKVDSDDEPLVRRKKPHMSVCREQTIDQKSGARQQTHEQTSST